MNDLISRQAVKEWLAKWEGYIDADTIARMQYRVIDIPSAQRWIPCSERLPEVDESVLVTTEWNDISIAWRIGIDKWFIHEGNTNATTDDLIAWMPLPEPWKGDSNG